MGHGNVAPLDRVLLKLCLEVQLSRLGAGDHHQPAGALVDSVYGEGGSARELADQAHDIQVTSGLACGDTQHAGRFPHDDECVVTMQKDKVPARREARRLGSEFNLIRLDIPTTICGRNSVQEHLAGEQRLLRF